MRARFAIEEMSVLTDDIGPVVCHGFPGGYSSGDQAQRLNLKGRFDLAQFAFQQVALSVAWSCFDAEDKMDALDRAETRRSGCLPRSR